MPHRSASLLGLALALAHAVAPAPVAAQDREPPWMVGASVLAPARLADAFPGQVDAGLGLALEGGRVLKRTDDVIASVMARVYTAGVEGQRGGSSWDAGRTTVVDAMLRAEHLIGPVAGLFAGVGVSRWSGPDHMAPFSSTNAVQMALEFGAVWTARPPWQLVMFANAARFGDDVDRGFRSGTIWRFGAGVRRAY